MKEASQEVGKQASTVVQVTPVQEVQVIGVLTHPVALLQESTVHTLLSLQSTFPLLSPPACVHVS